MEDNSPDWYWQHELLLALQEQEEQASADNVLASFDENFNQLFVGNNYGNSNNDIRK